MSYLLGVDAGNTKTVALVASGGGALLGHGRAGCGDIYGAASPEAAIAQISLAVTRALDAAGIAASALATGAFSLAGADWPEDFALLEDAMRQRGFGRTITVYNDAIGALRAGTPDGTGLVVACGTGAAIGARSADGTIWHTSFWQEHGGGDDLGDQAYRAVLRAELGIDPPTQLTERVLSSLAMPSVTAMLHANTARTVFADDRPDTGKLGRILLDAAADGDPTAIRITTAHGAALGDYALAAARKVGLVGRPFPLVLAGGVFRHPSPLLRNALIMRVRRDAPGARPVHSGLEPAVGALLLAFEQLGIAVDGLVLARIADTMPPSSFFAT